MLHRVANESDRDGALRVLQRAIHSCRLCTGLPAVAVPKVHGSARARVVVVGQALSLAESMDPAARPFDDATGRTFAALAGRGRGHLLRPGPLLSHRARQVLSGQSARRRRPAAATGMLYRRRPWWRRLAEAR